MDCLAHAAAGGTALAASLVVLRRQDAFLIGAIRPGVCVARNGDTSGQNIHPTKSGNTNKETQ